MTDWKTWPNCVFFLNVPPPPEQQTCQIWISHNFFQCEIRNLIYGWARYETEHRVEEVCCTNCFIVSVMSFHLYFDKQVQYILEKNQASKKNLKLEFCWIKCALKNKRVQQLWDIQFIFLALYVISYIAGWLTKYYWFTWVPEGSTQEHLSWVSFAWYDKIVAVWQNFLKIYSTFKRGSTVQANIFPYRYFHGFMHQQHIHRY